MPLLKSEDVYDLYSTHGKRFEKAKRMLETYFFRCPNSPLMLFTESYLKFFCGEYGPAYLDNYSCISKSLEASHQCRNYIRGVPNPIQSAGKCRGVSDFFECVEGDLSTECGEISSTLFRRSLEDLGCFEATEESKLILLQTNSTKLLTDQYRRDYFATAPKMEITVVTELPRGVDDYPKMPEIAFDEDTRSNTTVTSKGEKTTTTPQVAPTDGKVIRSTDHGTPEFSTQLLTSTESTEGIHATSVGAVEFLSTAGTDDGAPHVLTTEELEVETTEFVVTTTTHPPFCIPYRDHLQITFCHRNFMRKLNELKEESPESTSVRFPLFNVTLETLISICDDLSDTRKCMGGVDKLCIHPLLNFLEQQFYPTCQLLKMRDFDVDYVCIQRILRDREDCTGFVSTKIETTNDKCFGHAEFLSCVKQELQTVCGEESYNSVVTMLRGYGCNVSDDIVAATTLVPRTTTTTLRPISTTTKPTTTSTQRTTLITRTAPPPPSLTTRAQIEASGEDTEESSTDEADHAMFTTIMGDSSEEVDNNLLTRSTGRLGDRGDHGSSNHISDSVYSSEEGEDLDDFEDDDPAFNYTISSNCTTAMRDQARICTAPLMRTWVALRETWPHLSEVSFPIYKYSRVELLELCDSYANVFLCTNLDHIRVCIMDELVRFAQDHLGYICSPQNIQRFMTHYDCIMEQEATGRGNCRKHIIGEAVPGKDQHKCKGVKPYRACLAPYLKKHCQPGALEEFDASVRQFGCQLRN
ncbi:hypothetical protein Q1695_003471 [Nippostrongylus brasiliensis]|nr:hypothetical protein Q1695_003471 [Nippostrongylus brasiliensis]